MLPTTRAPQAPLPNTKDEEGFVVRGCGLARLNGTRDPNARGGALADTYSLPFLLASAAGVYWPDGRAGQLDDYSRPYMQVRPRAAFVSRC